MMLGDLLAAARHCAPDLEVRLAAAEPDLVARLRAAADFEGETSATYLRIAVAEFGRFASEEDWATLTSRLRISQAPGLDCLCAMLEWRLARADPAEGPNQ
jgi:hypothetical protein